MLIYLQSGYVYGILFIISNILLLRIVSSNLHALQGFYFYHLARKGQNIRLARSRIPLVSGELLRGTTRFPSAFVILNASLLLIAFLATLGVNGDSGVRYLPVKLRNVTTLFGGIWMTEHQRAHLLQIPCSSKTKRAISYWPLAFNTGNERSTPFEVACQRGSPGFSPLLQAECVDFPGHSCAINDLGPMFTMNGSSTRRENKSNRSTRIYSIRDTKSNHSILSRQRGWVFQFKLRSDVARVVLLLQRTPTDDLFLAHGVSSSLGQFVLHPPVRLSPVTLAINDSNLILALRDNPGALLTTTGRSIVLLLDFLVYFSFGSERSEEQAYKAQEMRITEVSTFAVVLFSVLTISTVLLWGIRGLLHLYFIDKRRIPLKQLRSNEFDELSKYLRLELERANKIRTSSDYSVLGTIIDDSGRSQVAPIAPSTSYETTDLDHAEDETARRVGQAILSQVAALRDNSSSSFVVTVPITIRVKSPDR